jgi:hypothetical protein
MNIYILRIICHVRGGTRVQIPGRVIGVRGRTSSESLNKVGRLLFLKIKKCPTTFSQVSLLVAELTINWRKIREKPIIWGEGARTLYTSF